MENLPTTKSDLLRDEREAAAELDATLDPLTEEQLYELRDQRGWSIRDHLGHLGDWETSAAMLLERHSLAERFAALGVDTATAMRSDEDALNGILRSRFPRRTVAETRGALRAAHERLLRAIEALSDSDLLLPYDDYQSEIWGGGNGRPVMAWVVGNSSGHYCEHLPWIRAIAAQPGATR